MAEIDSAALDRAMALARAEAVEEMVVDLMAWAMRRDREFADRIAGEHNEWLSACKQELAANPAAQEEARVRTARHFMMLLGIEEKPDGD